MATDKNNIIIAGQECENCKYGTINDHDKSRVKVICTIKGREYYYGQCIPCDDMKKEKIT